MKKIVAIVLLVALLVVNATNSYAMPTLNSKNSVCLDGKITKIVNTNGTRRVTVKITENSRWKGHLYSIKLSKYDWNSWRKEQGKVKVGTKIIALLYKNNTPRKVTDDMFVNIRRK